MSSCSITSLNCMLMSGPVSTWKSADVIGAHKHLEGHLEVRVSNLFPGQTGPPIGLGLQEHADE